MRANGHYGNKKRDTEDMEIALPPEKEARLLEFATRKGKDAAEIVEEAVDRMMEYEAHFIEAVEEGRAAAQRGELLEHEDVVTRIEQMFRE